MQPSADLIPSALLSRCIEHVLHTKDEQAFVYSPREGLPKVRALIAEDLVRQGVPAHGDELIITTGSQQALDLIARALVNPGDTVLVDEATYAGALNLLAVAGARVIGIPTDAEGPDLEVLERYVGSGAKGFYVMPHCQNPTGTRISWQRREALVAWSRRAHVPLIEDDYASDLCLDESAPIAPLRALDGDVLYMGTYSKKLSAGLRIGYLLSPRAMHPRFAALKHAVDLGTSPLLQLALGEFLERGYLRAHLQLVCREYRRRRDALEGALRRVLPANYVWRSPQTGVQLWLPLPFRMDPEALFLEGQRQGVIVSPGSLNVVNANEKPGLRLTFCAEPVERLVEGARRLGKACAAMQRRDSNTVTTTASRFEAV
jgi:DNA-binding transcriptional MocR family regulator